MPAMEEDHMEKVAAAPFTSASDRGGSCGRGQGARPEWAVHLGWVQVEPFCMWSRRWRRGLVCGTGRAAVCGARLWPPHMCTGGGGDSAATEAGGEGVPNRVCTRFCHDICTGGHVTPYSGLHGRGGAASRMHVRHELQVASPGLRRPAAPPTSGRGCPRRTSKAGVPGRARRLAG